MKASQLTFQSTVISSKENGNCSNTVSTSTFSDQSWKNQFSPPGVIPRDPTVHNITFSETRGIHQKEYLTCVHQNKTWETLNHSIRPSASVPLRINKMSQEFSMGSCFESAHRGCTCSIYLLLSLWNQNNNPDNH